jgi:hypothetical protein
LGNLTLLTKKLNSTVSNGPWSGPNGKAAHLQEKDVLLLNSRLLASHGAHQWDEAGIDQRTAQAIEALLAIWPVPTGHKVSIVRGTPGAAITVDISDLIGAGLLTPGQSLYSRPGKYGGGVATLLSDGRIELEGKSYSSPSQAGIAFRGKHTNGWHFWRTDPSGMRKLAEVRSEYLQAHSLETEQIDDEESEALDA